MANGDEPIPGMVDDEPTPDNVGDEPSTIYASFRVGETDPRLGVKIKEILLVNRRCIVYIDDRAGELEAKAQFLRHLKKPQEDQNTPRDLLNAVRLIGEGVVELFSTQDLTYANAALDTADKFITQRAREVSRSWYFIPFLIFFAISIIGISLSYRFDSTMVKTIAVACMFAGGRVRLTMTILQHYADTTLSIFVRRLAGITFFDLTPNRSFPIH